MLIEVVFRYGRMTSGSDQSTDSVGPAPLEKLSGAYATFGLGGAPAPPLVSTDTSQKLVR